MTSLPAPADTNHPDVQTRRLSRVDGCPSCVVNYETPNAVRATEGGFEADYTCGDCGQFWITAWSDE